MSSVPILSFTLFYLFYSQSIHAVYNFPALLSPLIHVFFILSLRLSFGPYFIHIFLCLIPLSFYFGSAILLIPRYFILPSCFLPSSFFKFTLWWSLRAIFSSYLHTILLVAVIIKLSPCVSYNLLLLIQTISIYQHTIA